MGFYSGFGGHKSYLGYCDDGIIYSGSGKRNPIGRYEKGRVYNQFREFIGSYSGGIIYDGSGEHIASYSDGAVYNKYLNAVVGRELVGTYDDNPAEAAALVLLFLGGNAVNGDVDNKDIPNPESDPTPPPSNSSDTGCLGAILALLWGIISFVFVVIIPFLFVYLIIPAYLGISWIGILSIFLAISCGTIGLIPITFIFVFITVLIEYAFWPYYIIAVIVKIKTKYSKKELFKLLWKWFLKGPVAYVDLINLLNETNTLPRVAKFYSKRIEFFKKIFKKK